MQQHLTGDIKGLRIAVPKEFLGEGVGEAAKQSVLDALEVLKVFRCNCRRGISSTL